MNLFLAKVLLINMITGSITLEYSEIKSNQQDCIVDSAQEAYKIESLLEGKHGLIYILPECTEIVSLEVTSE